eukprot:TRINITY_DN1085_c0_g1_i3.p1 TRINITY_DN1085_c0_g1~~TRINITY_DN1085_c0_g1_i3.p1  ORF type:complete len:218 (+),score=1.33 TRINITY_DN1085_c0_g1_i3:592-1245(+)
MMGIHTISGIHSIITVYQKQDDLNLSMEKTLVKGENVTDPTSSLIPKQDSIYTYKRLLFLVALNLIPAISLVVLASTVISDVNVVVYNDLHVVIVYSLIFGPAGAVIRYILGTRNKSIPRFQTWTFLCNMWGCIVVLLARTMSLQSESRIKLIIESSLITGFAGSLTTVSSFIQQVYKYDASTSLGMSYTYSIVSILFAQIFCLLYVLLYDLIVYLT